MKKNLFLVSLLFSLLIGISQVSAQSMSLTISCKSVTVGQNTTCTLYAAAPGDKAISGITAKYSFSDNVEFVKFEPGTGWLGDDPNGITLYTGNNKKGNTLFGTITLKTKKAGKGTLTITNFTGTDENFEDYDVVASKSTTFTIREVQTIPSTKKSTTSSKSLDITKPSTNATTEPNYTNPSTNPTHTNIVNLRLTSLKVDDFPVTYRDGIYYATVRKETETVNITATAAQEMTILGTGTRTLTYGKNLVEITVRDPQNRVATYQLVITRPENDDYNTLLSDLKIVDHEIDFKPDVFEYTINVPYNADELYVIAESYGDDVIVSGDGLVTIKDVKDSIHVTVSFGNISSTEYIIHIRKNYMMIILFVIIGLLSAGCIGITVYFLLDRKNFIKTFEIKQNKTVAAQVRSAKEVSPLNDVEISGQRVLGVGRQPVKPIPVEPAPIKPAPVNAIVDDAPDAQVRITKQTTVPQSGKAIDTAKPLSATYNSDDIIIKDIDN